MDDIRIDKIVRSKRKTFSIEIDEKARLIIRAPARASNKEIEKVVNEKKGWITKKMAQVKEKIKNIPVRHFTDGEKFLFLGKEYPLEINENPGYVFGFENNTFIMDAEYLEYAPQLFEKWYRLQASHIFPKRVALFTSITGIEYNRVKISGAKTRWGSCSSGGNLNFTWKLVMAPSQVIDYVIVHEIAHLIELNHSDKFWSLVGKMCPEYKKHIKWLKDHGHMLEI